MRRRRSGRRGQRDSVGLVVSDLTHIAARFGSIGALTTGAVGFTLLYALLPNALIAWTDANTAKLIGPAATQFATLLD